MIEPTWQGSSTPKFTAETLVGYASLGVSTWPVPPGKSKIAITPYFGIDLKFQKKYDELKTSFAQTVFEDLIQSCKDTEILDPEIRHLAFFVDPANTDGIDFW